MLYDEKVIRENDYVPSSVARTLKSRKSGIIGMIVHTLRYQVGAQTVFMFGMNENEAVAMVGRMETRVPEAIDALLHGEPERKKAVFAINTHTFFLVLRELEHRKVRIPDDLGVCGYDALGWSELVYPGISSIYQPMRQMGVQAGEKIIEALQMER